jgi:hypothetical protein
MTTTAGREKRLIGDWPVESPSRLTGPDLSRLSGLIAAVAGPPHDEQILSRRMAGRPAARRQHRSEGGPTWTPQEKNGSCRALRL